MGSVARLIYLSGLFALVLSACGGAKGTQTRGSINDAPLKLLIGSCEMKEEKQEVTCPLVPFRVGLFSYAQTLEDLANCRAEIDEMIELCSIDKAEMQGKVNALQTELDRWYHNPWIMGLVGAAAGAAVVMGVTLSR